LPTFERILREQLLHLVDIETVVFLLPWRVRDKTVTYNKEGGGGGGGRLRRAEEQPDLDWMGHPAAAIGKIVKQPTVLYSDAQLQQVREGLRALCRRLNAAEPEPSGKPGAAGGGGALGVGASEGGGGGGGGDGRGRPPWRCAVVDPWEAAYSKHELQRERSKEEQEGNGEGGGWWTDSRHLHPSGDLMHAIVQLLAAAITGAGYE
jgi:hypothetical protein